MLCVRFGTSRFNVFLLYGRMSVAVPHHAADMLCCFRLSTLDPWAFCIVLAGSEYSLACMAEIDSCIVDGLGLDLHHLLCSTASCVYLLLHRVWLTWVVALGCHLWINGISSICLQGVSVHWYAWPWSTHFWGMFCDLTKNVCLATWPHVCRCGVLGFRWWTNSPSSMVM